MKEQKQHCFCQHHQCRTLTFSPMHQNFEKLKMQLRYLNFCSPTVLLCTRTQFNTIIKSENMFETLRASLTVQNTITEVVDNS